MNVLSFRAGIQGALVLTGLLAETTVGQGPAPVPLIVPFEKTETVPAESGVIDGAAKLTPPPDQQGGESIAAVPAEESLVEPLPAEGGTVPDEADLSVLAPEYAGGLPEMEDAILPAPEDPQVFWSIPGLDRPFGESSLLPVISDGFDPSPRPFYVPGAGDKSRTELEIGARTSLVYDSNVRRSGTVAHGADKADWILSVAPAVSYGWKAGHWTGDVAARVSYDQYANNDGMGGLGYSLGAGVRYDGGRWQAGADLGSSLTKGGNRYLGDYSEQIEYRSAINASYEISPKTLLDGSLSYRLAEPQSGNGVRTESLESIVAGLWKYSKLLELGPGFRYRWESSGVADDRVTVGPLLRTRYRLTGKTALDSDLGINFFESDGSDSESDVALFARLGVHYEMSRVWAFDFSLGNDSVADEAGGYRDTFQIRVGVSRPIKRANWRLGLGYEKIDHDEAVLNVGETTSFSVDTALMMKVFGDRADAELFLLWRDQQENGGGSGDWTGTQVGLSLSAKF